MIDFTVFFNQTIQWMNSIGLKVTSPLTVGLTFASLIILIFIIWIALRGCALWYWKVPIQVGVLESIDERLKNMEGTIDPFKEENQQTENEVPMTENQKDKKDSITEETQEKNISNNNIFNTGKSGRVYTEQELELQIRD